jgi:protein TonB
MSDFVLPNMPAYGATELKRAYKKYLSYGLSIAAAFHFAGIGGYWASIYLATDDEPKIMIRTVKLSDLGPPPSITQQAPTPSVAVAQQAVKPSIGIPVPVPDAQVSPEQTIATQTEMSQPTVPVIDPTEGNEIQVQQDIQIGENSDEMPPEFVPYEKAPEPLKKVFPAYPDLALKAGIEGQVIVKVWVDKEGKVKKALILKSTAEVFNDAALDAAKQWLFTPAMMNKGPVDVWMAIPFKFKVQSQSR